ncbi:hypothetical protein D3C79_667260 [compost metagenome]
MGGKEGSQFGLGLLGKCSRALAGLIEPVRLDEGVGDVSGLQLPQILDGTRAGLRFALQCGVALVSQSAKLLDDLVIDTLLSPRAYGHGHSVRAGLPQQGK